MKIIHTADWHIGSGRTLQNYLERSVSSLNSFFTQLESIRPGLIIISGDVFETSEPLPDEISLLLWAMVRLEMLGCPVVVIPGQHCWIQGNSYALNLLNPLIQNGLLKNINYFSETSVIERSGLKILAVPFRDDARLGELALEHRPDIVAAHVMVKGCLMESGHPSERGYAVDFSAAGYWAMGDIHKMQSVAENAWYSGSLFQRNFGESLPKGFLVYDNDSKAVEFKEVICNKPLVTYHIDNVKIDELPSNCWIRLQISEPLNIDLPSNVVKTVYQGKDLPVSENTVIDASTPIEAIKIDLFDGLEDELARQSLNPEEVLKTVELAKEIRKLAGL